MLVLATAIADLLHLGRRDLFAWANLAALAAGIALAFLVPVSKNRVSASCLLVSLGASGVPLLVGGQPPPALHRALPAPGGGAGGIPCGRARTLRVSL